MRSLRTTACLFFASLLLVACGSDEPETPADSAAPPQATAADASEPTDVRTTDEGLTAAAISVPLHELERHKPLAEAMVAGGWKINTGSTVLSLITVLTIEATRHSHEATIKYFRPIADGRQLEDRWRQGLERDGAAIYFDAEHQVLLGVIIESNRDAQQPLLDSLLASQPE